MTFSILFCILALSIIAPTVSAQDATTLTVTFLDASGAPVGQPLTIVKRTCVTLDTSSIPDGVYASVKTSDPRAGLNLYQFDYCQALTNSAVGEWPNADSALDTKSIRWEGTAPASRGTGSLSTTAFPPGMAIQTQVVNPDMWVMDPSKGIIVVIVVTVVMVFGVAIGVYQVYKAAQYVPPPKKPKKTGLNVKKIKKKDAYFKKPARDDQQTFQRLHNESPEPFNTRPPMMERSRDSQYSEAATTFVDWNNSSNNTGSNQRSLFSNRQYSDSISIDMRETGRSNSNNHVDLIQLDSHVPSHQNSHQRGRGGEVLVPMHTFDNNYHNQHQGRSAVRRSSSSRSR